MWSEAGNSTVGPESGLQLLSGLVDFVVDDVAVPLLNKVLAAGIDLPAIPGVLFTGTELTLEPGYLKLGLDFKVGDLQ